MHPHPHEGDFKNQVHAGLGTPSLKIFMDCRLLSFPRQTFVLCSIHIRSCKVQNFIKATFVNRPSMKETTLYACLGLPH